MKVFFFRGTLLLCCCSWFAVLYGQSTQNSGTIENIIFELSTEPGSYVYMDGVYQGVVNGQGNIRLAAPLSKQHIQLRIENPDFRSYEQTISTNSLRESDPLHIQLTTVGSSFYEFNVLYLFALLGVALIMILFTAGKRYGTEMSVLFSNRSSSRPKSVSSSNAVKEKKPVKNPSPKKSPAENFSRELKEDSKNENQISAGEEFDKYKIISKIAEGGVARIYEASNSHNERLALKVMNQYLFDEDMVNKFIGEGWALQEIKKRFPDSPVIHVFDYGRKNGNPDGVPYIAMELVEGRSLNFFIQNNVLGYEQKIELLRQLAYAIDTAHQCKVLHRDLSPDNILIKDSSELEIRLIDFGVARHEVHWLKGTSVGAAFGKPEYMAPEQIEGGDLNHTVDYYSLGVLIYALFAGRPPYQDEVMYRVFDMHINAEIPPLPVEVPDHIKNLIHSLMQKKPSDRPDNIEQIMEKLK